MIIYDQTINAADTVSTNGSANVMSTVYCVNKFSKQKIKIWNGLLYVYYMFYIYIKRHIYIYTKKSLLYIEIIYTKKTFIIFIW